MGCVLSLSRSCFVLVFLVHWAPNGQRTVPGKSPVSVLEPCALILNFGFECQYFFYNFLRGGDGIGGGQRPASVAQPSWLWGQRASCLLDYNRTGTRQDARSPHRLGSLCHAALSERIAVCVDEAVPVASGPWHGLGWVKVLAR